MPTTHTETTSKGATNARQGVATPAQNKGWEMSAHAALKVNYLTVGRFSRSVRKFTSAKS